MSGLSDIVPPYPCPIFCPSCKARHLDIGPWLTRLHKKHLCLECEKIFVTSNTHPTVGVSNEFLQSKHLTKPEIIARRTMGIKPYLVLEDERLAWLAVAKTLTGD
jgi:hypothetical protein